MAFGTGVMFALAAFFCWGVADFMIQRSTRKFGDWKTLFIISMIGSIILTPFVYKDIELIAALNNSTFFILLAGSLSLFTGSLIDFEALKKGKIVVVEPIYTLEIPVTIILAITIINEPLEAVHLALILFLLSGILLVSLKSHHLSKRAWLEMGVVLAVITALFMGASNFLIGFSSSIIHPLVVIWFVSIVGTFLGFFYLMLHKRLLSVHNDIKNNKNLLAIGIIDNLAWIAFALSVLSIPISIAVAI